MPNDWMKPGGGRLKPRGMVRNELGYAFVRFGGLRCRGAYRRVAVLGGAPLVAGAGLMLLLAAVVVVLIAAANWAGCRFLREVRAAVREMEG